jgi:hypothetical protein
MMGVEDKFDYFSVGEHKTEIVGHSPDLGSNIAYSNWGDSVGYVHALTPCCNAATDIGEDGEYCKGCGSSKDLGRFGSSTDLLRASKHPANIIKKEFGELLPPKSLEPKDQARVDQDEAARKERNRSSSVSFKAARLSGICRKCSALRDTMGNCGCNGK